jgi:hypothetical protein
VKRSRPFRIESGLLDRFDRINEFLAANGSEVIRRLIEQYVKGKEEALKVKVEEVIEMKEDFPTDGEVSAVGKAENGKYFFAWGPEFPYADVLPRYEVPDGASGIKWYSTKKEALTDMNEAVEARKI